MFMFLFKHHGDGPPIRKSRPGVVRDRGAAKWKSLPITSIVICNALSSFLKWSFYHQRLKACVRIARDGLLRRSR